MRGSPHGKTSVYKRFYPSVLVIALCSHYAYYYLVFRGNYSKCLPFVLLAIASMVLGYVFGSFVKIVFCRKKTAVIRAEKKDWTFRTSVLRKIAVGFILVGIAFHVVYYIKNPIESYVASYTASRGSGYITVFFNFWLLGMILLEFLSVNGANGPFVRLANRVLIAVYTLFYFVVLLKRRQIVMLYLALLAIWGSRMNRRKKILMYVLCVCGACVFLIMGRVRGYIEDYGFLQSISRVKDVFSWEWLSLGVFEGRYTSRTLNDVVSYVRTTGHNPSILLGVLFCMVPRRLLGGTKPLAFPEWYAKHFYPADYARGAGFAGSMVAELYLIGGIPLLILGYVVIGYISARIQKNLVKRKDSASLLIYSLFIYTILLLPRYDLASLLVDLVFLYLPMILACSRCTQIQGK